jgi:hypothetical protein
LEEERVGKIDETQLGDLEQLRGHLQQFKRGVEKFSNLLWL